ncbi:Mss4-like protein [Ampelomyces quisqualis]|uniref:Mss4-like protein n=1 Tax=Ampelomyces quisqualis TaxID=50730 RepID=A0A6A5QP24_AMPQU|nr:Mss4-like protein [Ampelomyces quisqualis]
MSSFNGKCHCGNTEWTAELNQEEQGHILCHCDTCKLLSGSPYTLNQIIPQTALKITKGRDLGKYTYKGDSGNGVHCYYCKTCTTHVYHKQDVMPDNIVLRTILLHDGGLGAGLKPAAEIYGKARLGWEKEVAQTFETTPPS